MDQNQNPQQMQTCVLKMQSKCKYCPNRIKKVLQKVHGVHSIKIDADDGTVAVSSTVDPHLFITMLAKAGQKAQLLWESPHQSPQNICPRTHRQNERHTNTPQHSPRTQPSPRQPPTSPSPSAASVLERPMNTPKPSPRSQPSPRHTPPPPPSPLASEVHQSPMINPQPMPRTRTRPPPSPSPSAAEAAAAATNPQDSTASIDPAQVRELAKIPGLKHIMVKQPKYVKLTFKDNANHGDNNRGGDHAKRNVGAGCSSSSRPPTCVEERTTPMPSFGQWPGPGPSRFAPPPPEDCYYNYGGLQTGHTSNSENEDGMCNPM